ncbi:MAG: single-stranded-DNA-specific exonuclease RecJ [Planctomycetota bacterium]
MHSRWLLPEPAPELCSSLSKGLGISPVVAQVLINRGISDAASARAFLNPDLNDLADPDLLPGMAAAVNRIYEAARRKEKILIYGDYDVDGTSATALLVRFFRLAGLDVEYYVPHRLEEGYGLNLEAISEFKRRGVRLIITVDCGVNAVGEAEHAQAEGIDLIITDHHEPGDQVAAACAVVDPKLTGSMHPYKELSGVGVAFKLAWAVAKQFSEGRKMSEPFRQFLLNSLGLVALGTVADVVPLTGENRILARFGLPALGTASGPGLLALISCARIRNTRLTTRDVAFGLGPRLNAAGRMAEAALAIELMLTDDGIRAVEIAGELESHNTERRRLQEEAFEHAREMVLGQPDFESSRVIVLAHDSWHAGVIGIVASKLVEEFNRPAVMIALDGAVGKGSARSVHGFHLFNALEGFSGRMMSFGGHAAAAGFLIAAEHIPALREHLNQILADAAPELFLPSLDVDAEILLSDLTERFVSELQQLEPHGQANRPPLFLVHSLQIAGRPRLMGAKGQHISFYVSDGSVSYRAVAFGMGEGIYDKILAGARKCSVVFAAKTDTWNGTGELEVHVKDIEFE